MESGVRGERLGTHPTFWGFFEIFVNVLRFGGRLAGFLILQVWHIWWRLAGCFFTVSAGVLSLGFRIARFSIYQVGCIWRIVSRYIPHRSVDLEPRSSGENASDSDVDRSADLGPQAIGAHAHQDGDGLVETGHTSEIGGDSALGRDVDNPHSLWNSFQALPRGQISWETSTCCATILFNQIMILLPMKFFNGFWFFYVSSNNVIIISCSIVVVRDAFPVIVGHLAETMPCDEVIGKPIFFIWIKNISR
ncbi:uncharacterized protein [Elaeis guineensis]|uniref:uncharacterized protein isoform X3 n=1 Tax=Elaeis guineensis var. tenera TaxID=51953 RepID=UPI00057B0610